MLRGETYVSTNNTTPDICYDKKTGVSTKLLSGNAPTAKGLNHQSFSTNKQNE